MGQQQLLLIVLGVIIVGIAVVVGINVFTANAASSNRDALVSDLTNLGSLAQSYYRKPTALGGGNNSFVGWFANVPASLTTTANMSTAVTTTESAGSEILVGTGTETGNDGSTKTKVTVTVTATGMTTVINN